MAYIKMASDIYWAGVHDRRTDLFEGLWPLDTSGVTYNSYLIRDEKPTLIDLVKQPFSEEYLQTVESLLPLDAIRYIVLNHMEPDHSSALLAIHQAAPDAVFLVSEKAVPMLEHYYQLKDHIQVVHDGDQVSLGRHTLKFVYIPFVHWPETMVAYNPEEQILFSCDAFGGYGAVEDVYFDDQAENQEWFMAEALRYYANVVSAVYKPVLNAIEKLKDLPIKTVAPSHGLIWRERPARILQAYQTWSEYGSQGAPAGITVLSASMYGSTRMFLDALIEGIEKTEVPYQVFDVHRRHVSYILPALWSQNAVVVASPTYEGMLTPPMRAVLDVAAQKRMCRKKVMYCGSYTWGGGARRNIETLAANLKWELAESFDYPGFPTEADLQKARCLGETFAAGLRE